MKEQTVTVNHKEQQIIQTNIVDWRPDLEHQ